MFQALPPHRLEPLVPTEAIQSSVSRVAVAIEEAYRDEPLTVLGVLKGSVFFLADLLRQVRIPLKLEFLRASSYGHRIESSGNVELSKLEGGFEGRHVLVVDDILDSGRTLHAIVEEVRKTSPLSIRTCVLVDKRKERAVEQRADFAALEIPDVFIVGYGLDYDEHYRNLPDIQTVRFTEDPPRSDTEA